MIDSLKNSLQRMHKDHQREQGMRDNPALQAAWEQFEILNHLSRRDISA
jgi:hypothetical protein